MMAIRDTGPTASSILLIDYSFNRNFQPFILALELPAVS
jgi:hypothetical protein